jgi:hypothetical protein
VKGIKSSVTGVFAHCERGWCPAEAIEHLNLNSSGHDFFNESGVPIIPTGDAGDKIAGLEFLGFHSELKGVKGCWFPSGVVFFLVAWITGMGTAPTGWV